MVLLDCNRFKTTEEYIRSLSKRARHEYTLVHKRNADLIYRKAEYNHDQLKRFMELWERQLVRGQPIQWAYPIATVENWYLLGDLLLLEAVKDGETVAMHFLRKEGNYWEAGPPMWPKDQMKDRHLGTYMWFHMALWGIENQIGIINFGGGLDEWREFIRRRKEWTNPKYKWRFIPQSVKQHPELEPDYRIVEKHNKKYLHAGNI